jgi:hypothetical protein
MKKTITIGIGLAALSALLVVGLSRRGESQPAGSPSTITVGIYAPTVAFSSSQARLQYVQNLARAIGQNTGVKVNASSFTSMSQLRSKRVDFAIIDGQCYAASQKGKLLATAKVGGGTSQRWALYSSQGPRLQSLKGKRLAYVKTGCNDGGFIQNAMLESEVASNYFSGKVGKPDVPAAVAEVVSRKGAQAVFAPSGSQKGLTKVFDTGSVPNPAFVQLNSKLPSSLVSKVASSVRSFGGGGAIAGWDSPNSKLYRSLRSRMGRRVKRALFANPSPVRVDARDVLIRPKTLDDWDKTPIEQHFEAPPERLE